NVQYDGKAHRLYGCKVCATQHPPCLKICLKNNLFSTGGLFFDKKSICKGKALKSANTKKALHFLCRDLPDIVNVFSGDRFRR
ncbi:MAG: hypothetical protein J6Q81_05375, partial [Lentisphaeria bacterium]|nr:hypothetical protein [Lentisphaeria bacterium]